MDNLPNQANSGALAHAPATAVTAVTRDFSHLLTHQMQQGCDYRNIYGKGEIAQGRQGQSSEALSKMVQAAFHDLKPRDNMEAMLIAQSITIHGATMQCLMRAAAPDISHRSRESALNQANKLSRTYAMLMDTLNKHRGNGSSEQRIIVQYVNVADGGQAIVGGSVTPAKGGGHPKNEEPPHAP